MLIYLVSISYSPPLFLIYTHILNTLHLIHIGSYHTGNKVGITQHSANIRGIWINVHEPIRSRDDSVNGI